VVERGDDKERPTAARLWARYARAPTAIPSEHRARLRHPRAREDGNPGAGTDPPAWNAALRAFQWVRGRRGQMSPGLCRSLVVPTALQEEGRRRPVRTAILTPPEEPSP
jgi:hypothetical protein